MEFVRLGVDELELPLVEPFETSFGVEAERRFLLLRLETRHGEVGWGECVAARDPLYNEESTAGASAVIRESIVPRWRKAGPRDVESVRALLAPLRGNRMAKSALEQAVVDLQAQATRQSLARFLGGRRARVSVGVSIGIQPSPEALVGKVGQYLEEGYRRIKLKVRPGYDRVPVRSVRRAYPDIEIWVDGNQAYTPSSIPHLKRLAEDARLAQVEQPFGERDLSAHAELARGAHFRVCLDESIVDAESLAEGLRQRALTCLNVKPGRVGGPVEGLQLARAARRAGVPSWVGGMLESGVGRAHNLHLASSGVFTLPGDISATSRYYERDIIETPFALRPDGTLDVPRGPGLGIEIDERTYRRAVRRRMSFSLRR